MVSRAVLAFQRFIRDIIREFRQSLRPSLITYTSVGPLQPRVGKRRRRTEPAYYDQRFEYYDLTDFNYDNENLNIVN